jgi:ATP-dependent helicase HrpA
MQEPNFPVGKAHNSLYRRGANPIPAFDFPEELPVSARRDDIAQALKQHPVIIVCGETGSGKTTQLPKICLSLGRGVGAGGQGLIGHTQPRRLAATSVAKRIASELNSELGAVVGYKIRFNDQISRGASVKLMTDGILLAETQTDPLLRAYDTLIIDEAHERSLNIDFLLGYLKQILPRRPDLKLIITSATIDAERFSRHFFNAPVIEVSGRTYPVEIRYRPPADHAEAEQALLNAVDEAMQAGAGDVLIFLPGEREIRETTEALRKHTFGSGRLAPDILPLFSRLSAQEQERIFKPGNVRRLVLATNVAETSLTVPGIRYVIDTGLARVKRYSYRQKVEQLQVEPISQAAANQRAGRCGRVAAGICFRLYSAQDWAQRPAFTDPEILRSSLAAVILRMKALKLDAIEHFPFIEAPSGRAVADGYALLQEIGALNEANELTALGGQLAKLPLDPRVARMLLAAHESACLSEALIIAAALSVQDPRDRPFGQEEAADRAHQAFKDEKSEFSSYLKIWQFYLEKVQHKKSQRKLNEELRQHFLNPLRLREWHDVHGQLHHTLAELGWKFNGSAATYEQLHCALMSGLLGNLMSKADDEPHFNGARGLKCFPWPGSSLAKKPGRWIMAAELVETSRLFARTLARIEPEWIEKVGAHLLRKSWSEPHWEKKSARVMAQERATLYGLTIYQGRRVDYTRLNAAEARDIFIREALVAGDWEPHGTAAQTLLAQQKKLLRDIEQLEHKARRQDVLVDDTLIEAFYQAQVPATVTCGAEFESWYAHALQQQPQLLRLTRDDVMRHEAAGITTDLFPKTMTLGGIAMALTYHFEPGSARDGVTLTLPLFALNAVSELQCEWLVPGMLKEKVQGLLKSLPQKIRRHCVPLPDYAAGFIERHQSNDQSLLAVLIQDLNVQRQLRVQASDFKLETLPTHCFMNFKLVDEHGRQLGMERSLAKLKQEWGQEARQQFQQIARPVVQAVTEMPLQTVKTSGTTRVSTEAITSWNFGTLPELLELKKAGQTLVGYPALVEAGEACQLDVFDDPATAALQHKKGLRRLFALQLRDQLKYLEKNVPGLTAMAMHYMPLGSQEELKRQILDLALERACLTEPWPTDETSFQQRRDEAKGRLNLLAQEIAKLCSAILSEYAAVQKKLPQIKSMSASHADIQMQLQQLLCKDFLLRHPYEQLVHFPRYLKALWHRIDKCRTDPGREAQRLAELQSLQTPWQRRVAALKGVRDEQVETFRWLLEELRVSLFAQELRTPMPVSVKRLQKIWQGIE